MYVYNRHKISVRYLSHWIKYQMTSGHGPRKPWTWVGLRPIRTIWFDQPPVGGVQTGQLKRRGASACSLSLPSCNSLVLLNSARSNARKADLEAGPPDSLSTKPTIGGGLRLCQSRNGATNSTIAEGELSRWRHAAVSSLHTRTTEGARAEHVTPETKNSRGKRNQRIEPALNPFKQVQTEFLILTELGKIWSECSNEAKVRSWSFGWLVKLWNRKNIILSYS